MSVKHVVQLVCDGCGQDAERRSSKVFQVEHFVASGATKGTLHLCADCRAIARLALTSAMESVSLSPRLLCVLVSEQIRKAVGV